MGNITFVDRQKELSLLQEINKHHFFLVVKGRRRIGKTTLLKKFFPKAVYIFVSPNKSVGWLVEKICQEYALPQFKTFIDVLVYLLDKNIVIIIDEFQNFLSVDKSIYGEMQRLIDRRKNTFLKIVVAGSSYSLMNKVFNDVASPLYGRRTAEIMLSHIPLHNLFSVLKVSLEEFIELWSVFEGVPYYYELLDRKLSARENIQNLLISKDALLSEEGTAVMSVEFGYDSKTYTTVLMAIAEGKTHLNEIASLFGNKTNEVVKYLAILRREFRFVRRTTPLLSDPRKSRDGIYELTDNFLDFWFYFVDRNQQYIEQERFKEVEQFFLRHRDTYIGKKFENFIQYLIKNNLLNIGFEPMAVGKQWGTMNHLPKDRNQYEIDIVAVDEKKNILFVECKWQEAVRAEEVLSRLAEKAAAVPWHHEARKESFALFAKSFTQRLNNWKGKEVLCFDLHDLKKVLEFRTKTARKQPRSVVLKKLD